VTVNQDSSDSEMTKPSSSVAYGLTVITVGLATLVRWLLDPILGDQLPYPTFFVAVIVSAWIGGLRPALLATGLGFFVSWYCFMSPRFSLLGTSGVQFLGLGMYLMVSFAIAAFGEAMRVGQRRFEELARQQEGTSWPSSAMTSEAILNKHSLRDVAFIGFGLLILVLLFGGVLGYRSARQLNEDRQMVAHTQEVVGALESLLSTLQDAETGQRGYLLAEEAKYLEPYENAVRDIQTRIAHLQELLSDNPDQQARLATLEQKIAKRMDELNGTVDLMKAKNRDAALQIVHTDKGKALMDDVRKDIAAMREAEEGLLKIRSAESENSYRNTVLSIVLPAIISAMLIGVVVYLSQRNIKQRQRAAFVLAEQKERLRTTLSSIGDAVISADRNGNVTYLNPVAESLTGWAIKDAAGLPLTQVFNIINESTRLPVPDPAIRALSEGIIVGLANHTVLVSKEGKERPIDDSAAPIRCKDGEIVGCVLVFRDITERRNLERQDADRLAASRMLASIVETSEDAIVSKSLDGIIQSWNEAAERVFGYTAEQAVGKPITIILPADRSEEEKQIITSIRAGKRVEHFETVRTRSDGQLIDISLSVSPIIDEAGRVVGAAKIARDITDRKLAEKRIYELLTELQLGDRRKDEFLATLAHELRGPLAPLRNMLEVLKRSNGDGELHHQARETMERQLGQMVRLVDDLLDVSRITRDKLELRQERVELSSTIYHSVEICRPLAECAKHDVSVTLPPEPIYLNADATRLTQVFSNILNNACKYTEPCGKIWVTAERQGSDAVVSIKDTGTGIPRDKLDSVFEMFSQVDRSLERSQGGLGIGLTLVKRLVEMHGGSVEARSEGEGKGSEFTVRLPILIETATKAVSRPDSDRTLATVLRILVVDDNRDSAKSLAMLLKISGHDMHTAHDGLDALEAAERLRPDVVLLDIGLPKLNGHDVCRRIREQPWGKEMVLIALTGWGQEDDRRKSQDAGFDHHMVKPVEYGALLNFLAGRFEKSAS
jgi:PAS domain S-box-containing protein